MLYTTVTSSNKCKLQKILCDKKLRTHSCHLLCWQLLFVLLCFNWA